jgi:hypothetical protein
MFTKQEIQIANATCRSYGASVFNKDGEIRVIVPKYVFKCINKEHSILDFGAGKDANHTKWLNANGFNITAWEFGDNFVEGVHDKNALNKQYDVIMASNILNVQSSLDMLIKTLTQIRSCLLEDGMFVCNYPASPRKLVINANDVAAIIASVFKGYEIKRLAAVILHRCGLYVKRRYNINCEQIVNK